MGVDTIIRIILAVLIAVALMAGFAALSGVVAGPVGAATTGLDYLKDTNDARATNKGWRDGETIIGQSGPDATFAPGDVFGGVLALVYPGRTSLDRGGWVWDPAANGLWLVTLLAAIPGAWGLWFGTKYLARFILGGG